MFKLRDIGVVRSTFLRQFGALKDGSQPIREFVKQSRCQDGFLDISVRNRTAEATARKYLVEPHLAPLGLESLCADIVTFCPVAVNTWQAASEEVLGVLANQWASVVEEAHRWVRESDDGQPVFLPSLAFAETVKVKQLVAIGQVDARVSDYMETQVNDPIKLHFLRRPFLAWPSAPGSPRVLLGYRQTDNLTWTHREFRMPTVPERWLSAQREARETS